MVLLPLIRHISPLVRLPLAMSSRQYNSNASISRANLFPSIDKTTGQRLDAFCKTRGLSFQTSTLNPEGAFDSPQLHTLDVGDAPDTRGTFLYFHGGGYTHPAGPGHFKLSIKLAQQMKCRQLCILQYSLLPKAKYPTQLAQAVEALRHLLRSFPPQQIAIGGDSAGGNMVLGLLAHLNTAHPDIRPIDLPSPLASAICISPRCSNTTTAQSFVYNADKDVIDAASLVAFVQKWQPASHHVWAAADRGEEGFWTGKDSIKASKMFIVAGADEVYLDDIQAFAKLISASDAREGAARQFVVAPKSVHVQAVVDLAMGIEDGFMTEALLDWAGENPVGTTAGID